MYIGIYMVYTCTRMTVNYVIIAHLIATLFKNPFNIISKTIIFYIQVFEFHKIKYTHIDVGFQFPVSTRKLHLNNSKWNSAYSISNDNFLNIGSLS